MPFGDDPDVKILRQRLYSSLHHHGPQGTVKHPFEGRKEMSSLQRGGKHRRDLMETIELKNIPEIRRKTNKQLLEKSKRRREMTKKTV